MTFSIMENLRGFFNSRPPLVVFMICLASFAITLITFAYIVKVRDLPDPDVTEDWNTFLEKFSHVQFCVSPDAKNTTVPAKLGLEDKLTAQVYDKIGQTLGGVAKPVTDDGDGQTLGGVAKPVTDNGDVRSKREVTAGSDSVVSDRSQTVSHRESLPRHSKKERLENVTVSLNFVYIPSPDTSSLHLNYAQFVAIVTADTLKLDVSHSGEQLSVFLSFPKNLSHSFCEEEKSGHCLLYRVPACVTFQGSNLVLPRTQRPSQDTCPTHRGHTQDGGERTAVAGTLAEASSRNWCVDGSRLLPQYTLDDSLTVFLSMHDKSVINLHLMRTSYFLFVMVVTLFCYALVKGRQSKVKSVHTGYDKVSSHA